MGSEIVFSNGFDKYQIYESLPALDWRVAAVNVNIIRDNLYFDLLIYSKEKNKLIPILLNVVGPEKIEIPTLLKGLDDNVLIRLYEDALGVITGNQNNIKTPNTVFFTEVAREIDIFGQNVNPQRRTFPGLSNYSISLKPIIFYKHIREMIQKEIKGDIDILDCSCGLGYGSIILGSINGARVLGADIDKEAIDMADMLCMERDNVTFTASSMESLGLKDVRFDYVVSLETIEHSENPDEFLSSAIRLLKDTGTLIMSLPHWRFHGNDLNSDHRTNWTPDKVKRFFDKYFDKIDLSLTEVVDLDNVLETDFPFKDDVSRKKIENIVVVARAKDLREATNFATYYKGDKPLKVLFVNHSVPPYEHTGTPVSTYTQMRGLKKSGEETAVLIPHPDAVKGVIKEFIDGNLIYKVPPLNWGEAFLEDAFSGYNVRWYLNLIEDVLEDFNPDIIHINDYVFMTAKIIELFEAKGIPIVREVHAIEELCFRTRLFNKDGFCGGPESPERCAGCILTDMYSTNELFTIRNVSMYLGKLYARFKYINYLYGLFDALIFPSLSWQEYMSKFISVPKEKAYIVPIGIDLKIPRESLPKKTGSKVKLACIGTVASVKGFGVLEKVFKEKDILNSDFVLYIYGSLTEPSLKERLIDLEKSSGGKIIYKGPYRREELPEILSDIDIGILPSLFESYSIAVREFLYTGIPVIASDTYGIPDIIKDGYNGLLFEVGNWEKLKEKLLLVLNDRGLVERLKEGAVNTCVPTVQDEANMLDQIYRKILGLENMQEDKTFHPAGKRLTLERGDYEELYDTSVSVIIVTYNSSSTIDKCLNSILSNTDMPFEIIIVDNNSKDDTVKICRDILSKTHIPYKIIENEKNMGYARGANRGVEASSGEYVVFMNPDVFVFEGWIKNMVRYLQIKDVGAVGPLSDYVAGLQKFQLYTKQINTDDLETLSREISVKNRGKGIETKLLIGFCLLTKRDILNKVGLFDENLFLGNDDLDFSWRLGINGYKLIIATDVFVHHEGQVSFKSENSKKTSLLVQESTNYLYKKLRDYYREDLPSPVDLWGVNWFKPYTSLTSIIILTLNNLEYTKRCVESIKKYTPEPYELIVVDNGSTDGTVEYLENLSDIKLVKNPTNVGFAMGNNVGMKLSNGDYIVVLNNDTVVTRGWLTRLIACAESESSIGIVGPRSNCVSGIQLVTDVPYGDNMDAMQEFARQWSLENSGEYDDVFRVVGFCMLIKREVIEKIGGFDPLYESGNFEDDDFCIRAIRAGFKIKIANDVFIHHYGNKTFTSEKISYTESMIKNWERFRRKWSIPSGWSIDKGYPIGDIVRGKFNREEHYVPLDITPLSIEGLRGKNLLGSLNFSTLKWFLEKYREEDDIALILYEKDPDSAYQKLIEIIKKLGYEPEHIPDIIIYSDRLSRFEEPRLIAVTDGIISSPETKEEWLEWAKKFGREIIGV
ncbi:MAG: glycosyltransferase [Dictyoglomi bacterium]|nr:glycosyltransferase [Dictyoglomota bacterium]